MNKFSLIGWLFVVLIFTNCSKDKIVPASQRESTFEELLNATSPTGDLSHWILPDADDYDNIPQEPKNPLNPAKVELGRLLFHETAFAQDAMMEEGIGTYSCSSCHIAGAGFRSGSKQGIADGGIGFGVNGEGRVRNTEYDIPEMDVQGTRPMSMTNVAFVENTMWNGSFGATGVNVGTSDKWVGALHLNHLGMQGIETQNLEGMRLHRISMDSTSIAKYGYDELFDNAFPEISEEKRYTTNTASFALSAYIRTLFTTDAPFQKYLKGDSNAMTYEEMEGGILFFGKAGCTNCHKGPGFSTVEFHAIGVNDMYQQASFNTDATDKRNLGRGGFTGNEEDNYKFKVPQLYNMADTKFYFHGSSHTNLRDVVEYFNKAIPENPNVPKEQISEFFRPLNLTDEEVDLLTLFLEHSLRDPNLERYLPEEVLSGQCFPNNDLQSRMDTGCF